MEYNNESVAKSKVLTSLLSCGNQLSPEWKAITTTDQRIYFVNRRTRSSHWFPPPEFWASKVGLPYGWEAALDNQSKKYYINHVTRTTTREDPRSEADQAAHLHMSPPQARRIELVRDAKIGFGFVAGSEKPVVIRSVIPNGPSHEKLFANDQILKVNGKDVRDASQADVISLIKSAVGSIELEVVASEDVQDTNNQHNRKSSLMSRTTRERRRSTPVSVRFADEPALVQLIGPTESVRRSSVPLIPNVLKVFLENGQTRSFRYDSNTTADEIFSSFSSKLDVKLMEHFSLVLTGPKKGQISYIQNNEKVCEIYTNRNCSSVNCLCKLNIAFVPKDHFELLSQDPNTFEYLYAQVTNMVVEGFYGMDLKYDLAIKLAALHIQQKAMEAAAGRQVKISVRQVEKEFGGLGKFVSSDLLHSMREKELRKILDQQIKQNENLASPGERHMSSLQCKLHYLNLVVEMFSYGGRYFDAELVDSSNEGPSLKKTKKQHVTLLVNLKYGVSQVVRGKVNVLCQLAEFHEITGFAIRLHEDNKRLLQIKVQEGKKIQLVCTTVDCLDIIALVTGYYKVYVDNTSNIPLPVQNEEKWPFAFLRDPPLNNAPDFYSRHRVVPDVWSYPSRFQTSNPKSITQPENTNPLNGHKEVFIDLSKAPPRFNETAISEEPEDDNMVAEETNRDQKDVNTSDGESLNQEDDISELVMSDEDRKLLETATSFLKSSSEDINTVNDQTQSDDSNGSKAGADNEELFASRKRRLVFSGSPGKENAAIKSAKTTLTENVEEDQDDLISELILAEAIWQEEEAGVVAVDAVKEPVELVSTDRGDSCVVVGTNSEESNAQAHGAVGEQKRFEVAMGKPGQLSANNVHSQSGDTEKIIDTSNVVNNDLFACFHSGDYGQGTTDVNQNILSNNSITKTASLAEHNEYMRPAVSGAEFNLHLDLSEQHDPFISTDPFQDRSPTPSPRDLEFDESKFDNKGIELADFVECGVKTQGLVEQQSVVSVPEKRIAVEGKGSDGNRSKSPVTLELRGDSSPVSDDDIFNKNKPVDLDNLDDSVASHMVSLEFVEDSETETESAMSDEGESLWSTFPEFFQPSRRLTYLSNKQAELSLAEEDQDADGLDFTETDRDVALVSIKNLSTEDESNSKHSVEISARQDGVVSLADDWDDLSTASSESFEYTYEVNAEFPSESEEASEDSGYVYLRDENDRGVEGIFDQNKDGDDFPSHISTVSLGTYISDKCDTSVDTFSSLDVKSSKVDEPTESSLTETTPFYHFDQGDFSEKNEFVEMSKSVSREESLRTLPGSRQGIDVSRNLSDESLKHVLLGRSEIINKGWRSLNDSEDKGMMLDRSYSPSDWIIPSPPTPTPELQEADIHIVSPPPFSPTSVEDELDDELKHLIVPPPPPSVNALPIVSGIRIVSPPPLDVNDSELDHLMYDYDDIRFLSLTDDHKLAKNNGLVSARSFDSNFTEDKKIQAQMVEMVSKEGGYARKSITISSRDRSILNPSGNSCNTNHTPIKQSFATYALTSRSLDSQSFLPNPSASCSSTTLVNAHTTWKRFGEKKHPLDDFPNKEVVNSPNLKNGEDIRGKINSSSGTDEFNKISNTNQRNISVNNRSRVPLKPKPPVPPKPRMFRTVSSEGKMDKADAIPGKSMKMSLDEDRGIVVEGYHKNKPVRSAADENHRNINAELGEAGRSSLDSLPQRERDLVHSNHSSRSPSTSPSAGQAPNKALAKSKKTQVHDSVNSCNVKLSADSILNTHLDSPYAKSTDISKEKSSQRLEAFRPALSTASNPVSLRASCPDTPAIDSPSSTADDILYKNEFNSQRDKYGTRRSSSFTCRSPYVPAPYSSSRTQSLYSAQSSVEKAHKSAPHSNRSSSAGSPTVNSGASRGTYANLPRVNSCFETATSSVSAAAPPSSGNKPHSAGMEPLFNPQQPTSHLSFGDSNNSSGDDTNRALPKPPSESSSLRLATVELQEDSCNNSLNPPPLPDSPPPPLPDSSPPKTIPVFDTDDFDFGESLIETFQDGIQMDSLETTTFDLPSSPNDVESKRSSALVDYKQEDSKCTFPERRDKRCGGNGLSRSLTITSIPRDINRRSLSEDWPSLTGASIRDSRTKRCSFPFNECFNLDDATAAGSLNYLEECQPEFLKAKCSKVCEEGLLKVSNLKKRLEPYLNGRASKPQLSKETKNWPLIFQNNARFLACDIKVISSSVKRGSPQFVSAMETSLDSLEKLVESCEKTYSTLNEKSNHNGRTLAVMVNEVLDQYRDIIFTVKAASGQPPDDPDVEVLVKKTNAVATLIASLIRTLRKY